MRAAKAQESMRIYADLPEPFDARQWDKYGSLIDSPNLNVDPEHSANRTG